MSVYGQHRQASSIKMFKKQVRSLSINSIIQNQKIADKTARVCHKILKNSVFMLLAAVTHE